MGVSYFELHWRVKEGDSILKKIERTGENKNQLRRLLEDRAGEIQRLEKERREEYGKAFYTNTGKLRIAMRSAFPNEYSKLR